MSKATEGANPQAFGDRLAAWRSLRGWTISEAARNVGVTATTWKKWESGEIDPLKQLRKTAAGLSVTMPELVRGIE